MFRAALNWARKELEWNVPNPFEGRKLKEPPGRARWLTQSEACRLAGLEDVHPHDLRRTFGSWLVQAGVPIQTVSTLLRHSDIRITDEFMLTCRLTRQKRQRLIGRFISFAKICVMRDDLFKWSGEGFEPHPASRSSALPG